MKQCLNCGEDFAPKNSKGVYCSDKCRVAGNRKKVALTIIKPIPKGKVVAKEKPIPVAKGEPKSKPLVQSSYRQQLLNKKLGIK